MAPSDRFALVGTTLAEKYLVEKVVGEGGSSVVYRAKHRIWQRAVALKAFKAVAGLSEEERRMLLEGFVREGILLAELSERSAAICQARDIASFVTKSGEWVPYLVLEWLDGENLEFVLRRERRVRFPTRTLAEAIALLEPVALALAGAHKLGIAHRDVKPGNLFVLGDARGECTLKLLDFGIANVVLDARRRSGAPPQSASRATSFTPAYGAPEQFSSSHGTTGPWTDVYALALILVELLTGKEATPILELSSVSGAGVDTPRNTGANAEIVTGTRQSPRLRGAHLTEAVEAVFNRALSTEIAGRYQDAGAFWNALKHAADRRQGPVTPRTSQDTLRSEHPAVEIHTPRSSRRIRATAIGIGLAAVAAIGLVRLFHVGGAASQESPNAVHVTSAHLESATGDGNAASAATPVPPSPQRAGSPAIAPPAMATSPAVAPSPAAPPRACPPTMAAIPGGHYFMGSDDDQKLARPSHKVTLSPYCIDLFEVTTADYKACSDRGDCKRAAKAVAWEGVTARDHASFDALCNANDPAGRGSHPVNCVDWDMANIYCQAHDGRLPTEAEWEFAARGSDGRPFPWGDDEPTPTRLNGAAGDPFAATAPVGSFPEGKSPFGVADMAGNVAEWVADRAGAYAADPQTDPVGPSAAVVALPASAGEARLVRGGAFDEARALNLRPTFRQELSERQRSHAVGFRCARTR